MIPPEHRKIAVEEYSYNMLPGIDDDYDELERMARLRAWAMGYKGVHLDVPEREVIATLKGVETVLSDCRDPMNLWAYAWGALEYKNYFSPWWKRWWYAFWEKVGFICI